MGVYFISPFQRFQNCSAQHPGSRTTTGRGRARHVYPRHTPSDLLSPARTHLTDSPIPIIWVCESIKAFPWPETSWYLSGVTLSDVCPHSLTSHPIPKVSFTDQGVSQCSRQTIRLTTIVGGNGLPNEGLLERSLERSQVQGLLPPWGWMCHAPATQMSPTTRILGMFVEVL